MDSNIKLSIKNNQIEIIKIDKNESKIAEDDMVSQNSQTSQTCQINDQKDKESNYSIISKISEDEKEKEFFTDSPIRLLLLKIFFLFE